MIYLDLDVFKGGPTIVILGDSQTAGPMGKILVKYYKALGYNVKRYAESGKGVTFFNDALRGRFRAKAYKRDANRKYLRVNGKKVVDPVNTARLRRKQRRIYLAMKRTSPEHVIVSSLGGNDARNDDKFLRRNYGALFSQLKSYGSNVSFFGSPKAAPRHIKTDRNRKRVDNIQRELAETHGVPFTSVRDMGGKADSDGIHRHGMAKEYVQHITKAQHLPVSGRSRIVDTPRRVSFSPLRGQVAGIPPSDRRTIIPPDTTGGKISPFEVPAPQAVAGVKTPEYEPSGSGFSGTQLGILVSNAASKYKIPENLIYSLVQQESTGNPRAVSPTGATGLTQLVRGTAKELGLTPEERFDPAKNLDAGVRYLSKLVKNYKGKVSDPYTAALVAYNMGPSHVSGRKGRGKSSPIEGYIKTHGRDVSKWPVSDGTRYARSILRGASSRAKKPGDLHYFRRKPELLAGKRGAATPSSMRRATSRDVAALERPELKYNLKDSLDRLTFRKRHVDPSIDVSAPRTLDTASAKFNAPTEYERKVLGVTPRTQTQIATKPEVRPVELATVARRGGPPVPPARPQASEQVSQLRAHREGLSKVSSGRRVLQDSAAARPTQIDTRLTEGSAAAGRRVIQNLSAVQTGAISPRPVIDISQRRPAQNLVQDKPAERKTLAELVAAKPVVPSTQTPIRKPEVAAAPQQRRILADKPEIAAAPVDKPEIAAAPVQSLVIPPAPVDKPEIAAVDPKAGSTDLEKFKTTLKEASPELKGKPTLTDVSQSKLKSGGMKQVAPILHRTQAAPTQVTLPVSVDKPEEEEDLGGKLLPKHFVGNPIEGSYVAPKYRDTITLPEKFKGRSYLDIKHKIQAPKLENRQAPSETLRIPLQKSAWPEIPDIYVNSCDRLLVVDESVYFTGE